MKPCVVLRADASHAVGFGHVVRSVTLGEALVSLGWDVVLVARTLPLTLMERARQASIAVLVLDDGDTREGEAEAVRSHRPSLVVLDGYHFEAGFYPAVVPDGAVLCVIDDNGENVSPFVDVVVNQNPSASMEMYGDIQESRHLLLGLEYALIRSDVARFKTALADEERFGVFVSLGGSDPEGLTAGLASEFSAAGIEARVAIGQSVRDRDAVVDRLSELDHVSVVDEQGYVQSLATARLAVIGAGTTMWEAACLGTPSVAIVVADNQAAPAVAAAAQGFAVTVDARSCTSPRPIQREACELLDDLTRLEQMTASGRAAVDGCGATRAAVILSELVSRERSVRC